MHRALTLDGLMAAAKSPAGRGALWTLFTFGTGQMMRLVSTLVLTRLLFPEAFGLMALVGVFLFGLEMISDAGLRQSVIRHPRGEDPDFLGTVFTLQLMRGVAFFVCASLLAVPIARLYDEPVLVYLLPVCASGAIINGFLSMSMPLANRRMEFGRVAILSVFAQLLGVTGTIALAAAFPSVWALVFGGLCNTLVTVIGSHVYLRGPSVRFKWDPALAKELLTFGKWILASSAITFVSIQGDKLLLGHYVPMAVLGSYALADQLARLLRQVNDELAGRIAFPMLAAAHQADATQVSGMLQRAQRWMDICVFGSGFAAAIGQLIIDTLYDERYASAGWMLQILCVRAAIYCATRSGSNCLVATGRPYYGAAEQLASAIGLAIGIIAGWHLGGLTGLLWGLMLSELAGFIVVHVGLHLHKLFRPLTVAVSAVLFLLGWLIGRAVLALL